MKCKKIIVALLIILIALAACFLECPFVSSDAKIASLAALQSRLGSIPKKGTLIIVDFSQPSQTKRLSVLNLETGKTLFHARAAHGKNSGGVYALKLSNAIGSLQSSAGLFAVTEIFSGRHGASLRLAGLNADLNGNAEQRGIIIHSAEYVSLKSMLLNWKEKFRLGRSQGCFALSPADFQKLNKMLVRPAYLYAHLNNSAALASLPTADQ